MDLLPTQARVVIVGGGIVGCSVAYHLTELGWRDVVLIEQGRLSGGTTWHAAGLVGQLRAHANMTRLIRTSTELYASLEEETGLATGWKQCGSLTVARTPERMTMLRRTASMARAQGVAIELLGPREAVEKTRGTIACEVLCICAGQWSREVGRLCGVTVPLHSAEHMYIVTGPIAGVHPDLPVMRDPDGFI